MDLGGSLGELNQPFQPFQPCRGLFGYLCSHPIIGVPDHMDEQTTIFGNSETPAPGVVWADTTLQTLNRRVGKDNLVLVKDQFEKSVDEWDGIPVFIQEDGIHPDDFEAVTKNPEGVASSIGGRFIGYVRKPHIETDGHPRLMATLEITDNRAEELYQSGELGVSTGFRVNHDGNKITSPPEPNHVLLFREIVDKAQPGDPGALVHTDLGDAMTDEKPKLKSFYSRLKQLFAEFNMPMADEEPTEPHMETLPMANTPQKNADSETPTEAGQPLTDELAQKDAEIAALKDQIASLESQVEALKAELDTSSQELQSYRASENDRKFDDLVQHLPEGMAKTPEQRNTLRAEFEKDPLGTTVKILNTRATGGETSPVGDQFVHTSRAVQRGLGNLSPHAQNYNQKP